MLSTSTVSTSNNETSSKQSMTSTCSSTNTSVNINAYPANTDLSNNNATTVEDEYTIPKDGMSLTSTSTDMAMSLTS